MISFMGDVEVSARARAFVSAYVLSASFNDRSPCSRFATPSFLKANWSMSFYGSHWRHLNLSPAALRAGSVVKILYVVCFSLELYCLSVNSLFVKSARLSFRSFPASSQNRFDNNRLVAWLVERILRRGRIFVPDTKRQACPP